MVKDLISANKDGLPKKLIIEQVKNNGYDGNISNMVTNALSGLSNKDEIERYKPKGKKMMGYYWRIKP
jgi:hypothetical protein